MASAPSAVFPAAPETHGAPAVRWETAPGLVDYLPAVARMEAHAEAIRAGAAPELVWLLEHLHVYTAGTSASEEERVATGGIPVVLSGRGGRTTYHGPGQRVVYLMLDLGARGRDVRRYVDGLEHWIIAALGQLGVDAFQAPGRIGVWVRRGASEAKIAAVGIRVRRWVTFHGVSINVAPDLARFDAIVPCGIREFGVTSLADLGSPHGMRELDLALRSTFDDFLRRLHG
jgi:lipoyl(octanoyl) transferase